MPGSAKPCLLITGATRGIGLALLRALGEGFRDIVLVSRDSTRMKQLKRAYEDAGDIRVYPVTLDLTVPGAAAQLYKKVKAHNLRVQCLINNAGMGALGPFADSSPETLKKMIQLNVCALSEITREFLPDMVADKKGALVNVASVGAFFPGPYLATYYATKAFVWSLTEAINQELRGSGVKVHLLCPGPTETEFHLRAGMKKTARGAKADAVAEYAVQKIREGKSLIIPGLGNRLVVFLSHFIHRRILLFAVALLQKSRLK